jgi:hypothetical protein
MPFVKKQKNDAYFSRYQVKYRRRREGKTDCECVSQLADIPLMRVDMRRLLSQAHDHAGQEQVVRRCYNCLYVLLQC